MTLAQQPLTYPSAAYTVIRTPSAGLLYDESRRWHIAWFGWALFWIGTSWSVGRMFAYGAPGNNMTSWLFIIGCGLLLPVFMSQPGGRPEATPNGRAVVESARTRHAALLRSFGGSDVHLAVALFGADAGGREHAGVRDTYELLAADAERFIGL